MTGALRGGGTVICPVCLRRIRWRDAELHIFDKYAHQFQPVRTNLTEVASLDLNRAGLHRKCPNPSESGAHYLPYRYGDYGEPIVIGVVGAPAVGKTVYLTSLITELLSGVSTRAGHARFSPLCALTNDRFLRSFADPLFRDGRDLAGTESRAGNSLFNALHLHDSKTGRESVVAFFDIAGEDLWDPHSVLPPVSGLLFLVDPGNAVPRVAKWPKGHYYHDTGDKSVMPRFITDRTFDAVCSRIGPQQAKILPTATIVTKSDLVQYQSPHVARWLFRGDDADCASLSEESADVYAFLEANGAGAYLRPFTDLGPGTLHFASATGVHARDRCFPPHRLRPRRVVRPLLSVLRGLGALS